MVLLKVFAWILSALLFVIIISLFTKITIDLTYKFETKDQRMTIVIKALFGLIRFRIEIPKIMEETDRKKVDWSNEDKEKHSSNVDTGDEDEALQAYRPIKSWLKDIKALYRQIKKSLKKVRITKLEWKSAIGTGDAASTGIVSGAGWAFKGTVIGVLSYYFSLKVRPKLEIKPVFNRKISNTYIKCIFQVRAGHAILAGLKLFKLWKQMKSNHALPGNSKMTNEQKEDQTV